MLCAIRSRAYFWYILSCICFHLYSRFILLEFLKGSRRALFYCPKTVPSGVKRILFHLFHHFSNIILMKTFSYNFCLFYARFCRILFVFCIFSLVFSTKLRRIFSSSHPCWRRAFDGAGSETS